MESRDQVKELDWEYMYRSLAEKSIKLTQAIMQLLHVVNGEQMADVDETVDKYIDALANVHFGVQIARMDLEKEEAARFNQLVSTKKMELLSKVAKNA